MPWETGDTVVLREIWRERIWTARPVTVVDDMPQQQIFYMSPGARWLCPRDDRGEWLRLPTSEGWTLDERALTSERVLSFAWPDVAYAILLFWDDDTDDFQRWYVNLQEPFRRTAQGFDTQDLELDIVVSRDGCWRYKDDEKLEKWIERGRWTPDEVAAIRHEGAAIAAELDAGRRWWSDDWASWEPDPSWATPPLPPDWDASG